MTIIYTPTARLEALGLTVPIGSLNYYHDDGFVPDVNEHYTGLLRRYDLSNSFQALGDSVVGRCTKFPQNGIRHTHIYYINTGVAAANLGLRAHEETHAIDNFVGYAAEGYGMFGLKVSREVGAHVDFLKIRDAEVKAELGAICVLAMHDINPEIMRQVLGSNPAMEEAMRIFHEGSC